MKTQPSKLLLALAVCFSMAAAHASDNSSKNVHSSKDTSGKSSNTTVSTGCTATVQATACGPVQVTTCSTSGSTTATAINTAQSNKDSERHKDDGKDRGDGKDHNEYRHSDNSKYSSRDNSKDDADDGYNAERPYGYHWEQTNSGGVKQRKVTICHREGGARTTIDVDDDGRYHGHDRDVMDTEGACEDQDDRTGKHTDSKNRGRNVVSIHTSATCGVARAYAAPDTNKHHKDEVHGSNANNRYANRDTTKDNVGGAYRWEHDKDGLSSTTNDRQRKVTICHNGVTLDVDDDGWYHGHSKHATDRLGPCGTANAASIATEAACTTTTSTTAASCNVTAVLGSLGCGNAGVTCTPLATGTRPMRGGLRNVR